LIQWVAAGWEFAFAHLCVNAKTSSLTLALAACAGNVAWAQLDADLPKLRLGHYSSGDGLRGLILDRTGPRPLARMDGDDEVLVLHPGGPFSDRRGVRWTSLKLDTEDVLLDVAESGQVKLHAQDDSSVLALHRDADGEPLLRPSQPSSQGLRSRCEALTASVTETVGTPITLTAAPAGSTDLTAFEGAAENASRALRRVGDSNLGKRALRRLTRLEIRAGDAVDIRVQGATAEVRVVPAQGLAGRPSSVRIQKVLEANL
jgi:hypothetical protein